MLSISNSPSSRLVDNDYSTANPYVEVFNDNYDAHAFPKQRAIDSSQRTFYRRFVQGSLIDCIKIDYPTIDCFCVSPAAGLIAICAEQSVLVLRLSDYSLVQRVGHVKRTIAKNQEYVSPQTAVAIDPTGQYVATCGSDSRILIWNIKRAKCEKVLDKHKQQVFSIVFDGKDRIISAGEDGRILIWNWKTTTVLSQKFKQGAITRALCVTFTPAAPFQKAYQRDPEHLLFSGSNDGNCTVWDMDTNSVYDSIYSASSETGHSSAITTVARSPDRRLLAVASADHNCYVYSLRNYFDRLLGDKTKSAAYEQVASGYLNIASLTDWDSLRDISNRILTEIPVGDAPLNDSSGSAELLFKLKHSSGVLCAEFGQFSDVVVTGCMDSTLKVWSALTGILLFQVNTPFPIRQLALPRTSAMMELAPWEQKRQAERSTATLNMNSETANAISKERVYCTCGNRVLVFDFLLYTREDFAKISSSTSVTSSGLGSAAMADSSKPEISTAQAFKSANAATKLVLAGKARGDFHSALESVDETTDDLDLGEQCVNMTQLAALAEHGRLRPGFLESVLQSCPQVNKRDFYDSMHHYQLDAGDILNLIIQRPYPVSDLLQLVADRHNSGVVLSMLFNNSEAPLPSNIAASCGLEKVANSTDRKIYLDPRKDIAPAERKPELKRSISRLGLSAVSVSQQSELDSIADNSESEDFFSDSSETQDENEPLQAAANSQAARDLYVNLTRQLDAASQRKIPKNRVQLKLSGNSLSSQFNYAVGNRGPLKVNPASTSRPMLSIANSAANWNSSKTRTTDGVVDVSAGYVLPASLLPIFSSFEPNRRKGAPNQKARTQKKANSAEIAFHRAFSSTQVSAPEHSAPHVQKWSKLAFEKLRDKNTNTAAYLHDFLEVERNQKQEQQLMRSNMSQERRSLYLQSGKPATQNWFDSGAKKQATWQPAAPGASTYIEPEVFDQRRLAQLQRDLNLFTSVAPRATKQQRFSQPAFASKTTAPVVRGLDVHFSPDFFGAVQGYSLAKRAAQMQIDRQSLFRGSAGFGGYSSGGGLSVSRLGQQKSKELKSTSNILRDQLVQSSLLSDIMQINPGKKLSNQAYSNTAMGGLIVHPSEALRKSPEHVYVDSILLKTRNTGLKRKLIVGNRVKLTEKKLRSADPQIESIIFKK